MSEKDCEYYKNYTKKQLLSEIKLLSDEQEEYEKQLQAVKAENEELKKAKRIDMDKPPEKRGHCCNCTLPKENAVLKTQLADKDKHLLDLSARLTSLKYGKTLDKLANPDYKTIEQEIEELFSTEIEKNKELEAEIKLKDKMITKFEGIIEVVYRTLEPIFHKRYNVDEDTSALACKTVLESMSDYLHYDKSKNILVLRLTKTQQKIGGSKDE